MSGLPIVEIEYCRQCRWLLRAGWTAQELLTTFEDELGGVTLIPGTGGVFELRLGGEVFWSRKAEGRFPELKEVKQRLRDRIAPERDLGHSDAKPDPQP
ncbi:MULTISPECIES: SelT/SelW/SelH family protein [Rhodomicrobium]|uniref:SelT/SelW/SelH family protein n=1 Tax=Rhodomicrobium TaxID=1068 RepID=UPI000B4AE4C9|nr:MULTISPECIES: SelT/SelW/SelH family protein [Rhodomicrobium]